MKGKISKVQELVYELRVNDVMRRNVIAVKPGTPMAELRQILRDNKISGTPVADGDRLVGIVSLEDFIKWLAEGMRPCNVSERMTEKVETLYSDEPVVHVMGKIEQFGFGRFPVIDRGTNKLVGIVTKGDIIEGLLRKLEIDYHRGETRKYRHARIFEDITADRIALVFQYHVNGKNFNQAGEAASGLKKTLKHLRIHPDIIRRSAIAAYEAEVNIIIYTDGGEMTVTISPGQIYIKAEDSGPGIPDIEKAMQPGFSTAPDWVREMGFGAGMGLNNIQRCSDKMVLNSTVGKGTCLEITIEMNVDR
jgi:CBS domain-containing protein/anti-sigma regulatory factor (Ser/Thr protein kinase)